MSKLSGRVQRVESSAHVAMSGIFRTLSYIDQQFEGASLTITRVKASSDLGLCSFFIASSLAPSAKIDNLIELLNKSKKKIRFLFAKNMQIKYVPEIRFFPETGIENESKVSRILEAIKI